MGEPMFQHALLQELQWQLESMQLVNFGPFDGHHQFDFETGFDIVPTTVISGASGTGKSTLQDAFFEVMTRNGSYNTASNEGGRGASLSSEKRSLIGYVRGKLEDVEDEMGNPTAQLLRDGSCNRWSAIVLTYVSNNDTAFSVVKLFWIAAGYNTNSDIKQLRLTMFDRFDPRVLEAIADANFTAERVRRVVGDGFKAYARVDEFLTYVYSTLKIDELGRGKEVMDLLGRIRSGANFRSIAELFREQVLDVPITYQRAEEAAESYHKHREAYEKMLDKQRRVDALTEVRDLNNDLRGARENAESHHVAASDGVFNLWRRSTKREMVKGRIDQLSAQSNELGVQLAEVEKQHRRASAARDELAAQVAASGYAEKLALLDSAIAREREHAQAVRAAWDVCARETEPHFGKMPETEERFQELQQRVGDFLDGYDAEQAACRQRQSNAVAEAERLKVEVADVRSDLEYYGSSKTRIPPRLGEARRALAAASGIPEADLPFAAELMEVNDERWRLAVESVYGGFARTLLVDADDFERFSASIDELKLRSRVNFRRVRCGTRSSAASARGYLSEMLDFDEDSPFAGWLIDTVRDEHHDALRVGSPEELRGPGRRVTVNGQTREGGKGAHGRDANSEGIIGFDNSEKVDALIAQLSDLAGRLEDASKREAEAQKSLGELVEKRSSAQRIAAYDFASVDIASARKRMEDAEERRRKFLEENEQFEELQARYAQAQIEETVLAKKAGSLESTLENVAARLAELQATQDGLADQDEAAPNTGEEAPSYQILAETAEERFAGHSLEDNLNAFDEITRSVRMAVAERADGFERQANLVSNRLIARLEKYLEAWPDTHLGTAEESVPDYLALLTQLEAEGFHEQKESWYQHMVEWIKEDLIPLDVAWRDARAEIDDKLEPINDILSTLPFGRDEGRLEIVCRDSIPKEAREFASLLRELLDYERDGVGGVAPVDEAAYHRRAAKLMDVIDPQDTRAESMRRRNEVLDRRRHVRLTARVVDPNDPDRPKATYNALASKSGGEVAEIVAFILGAALLYRLGQDGMSQPGFAPVLLDEGFIKADSQFTSRAIAAWQGFGFQLLIAAPEEKYQSVVAKAQAVVHIVVDSTRRSYVSRFTYLDEGEGDASAPGIGAPDDDVESMADVDAVPDPELESVFASEAALAVESAFAPADETHERDGS